MIIAKKMLVICALSSAGFLGAMEIYDYGKMGAAEEKAHTIDAKILLLKKEQSEVTAAIEKIHGNSTIAYRAEKKHYLSKSNAELEKLRNEKVRLQSKL